MRGPFDRRICHMLQRAGILTAEKANSALEQAGRDEQRPLEEILVADGYVEESAFLSALSAQARIPPIDLRRVVPEPEALQTLGEDLAKHYLAVPVSRKRSLLTIAVGNPFDLPRFDELAVVTECEIRPVLASVPALKEQIRRVYNPEERRLLEEIELAGAAAGRVEVEEQPEDEDASPEQVMDLESMANLDGSAPVVRLVTLVITQGIQKGASDIHIHPTENSVQIRYRIDGALQDFTSAPRTMHSEIITRIKVLAGMNVAERRVPQDGRIQVRFEGRQVDLRVALVPTIHGERIVIRLLDSSNLERLRIDTIGFEERSKQAFLRAVNASYGMILVTGPTGSGKTTTLYASLNEILDPKENVTTVEDPVEYQLTGVNQVPVSVKRGLTFAGALRSILRQDPDIIMIGEIRDLETADIAIKAALTGHLVLSTVHTNDAVGTIPRLIDMGVDHYLVASVLLASTSQRLLRRLCRECRRPMDRLPPEDYLLDIGFREDQLRDLLLYEPVGCHACFKGYRGRFGIFEVLEVDREIRQMIVEKASAGSIKKRAMELGMLTLRQCGILAALRGETSLSEVLAHTLADRVTVEI